MPVYRQPTRRGLKLDRFNWYRHKMWGLLWDVLPLSGCLGGCPSFFDGVEVPWDSDGLPGGRASIGKAVELRWTSAAAASRSTLVPPLRPQYDCNSRAQLQHYTAQLGWFCYRNVVFRCMQLANI